MKHISLSLRLSAAADWVPEGARLCDVGTDHASLPLWLTLRGRLRGAIATDIRQGPLQRARHNVERYGCADKIELRLCDGLSAVAPTETDTVTICGMGGKMIQSILQAAPWTQEETSLILQPMKSQGELRSWLLANGYRIRKERVLLEEGHWYTLLSVHGGQSERVSLTPGEMEAGSPACWCRTDDRLGFLRYAVQRLARQRDGLTRSSTGGNPVRLDYLRRALAELSEWREQLEQGVWPE